MERNGKKMDRIIADCSLFQSIRDYRRSFKKKKKVVKWDDKTTPKKEKRHNKTRDIEREDEI